MEPLRVLLNPRAAPVISVPVLAGLFRGDVNTVGGHEKRKVLWRTSSSIRRNRRPAPVDV